MNQLNTFARIRQLSKQLTEAHEAGDFELADEIEDEIDALQDELDAAAEDEYDDNHSNTGWR